MTPVNPLTRASKWLDRTPDEVADMPAYARRQRVHHLTDLAAEIVDYAAIVHAAEHEVVGRVVLFSGGNDSTVLAHLAHHTLGLATHAAHANTTIGIERTREFVRDTCASWGLPLIERAPDEKDSFRSIVLDRGFPGPAHHWKMYQRLKERALRKVRAELVTNPRRQRVIFLAGRRRHESARRANVPELEREGSVVWVSPLVLWTALDMNTYREINQHSTFPVPRNEVSDLIHMSGECLCGAFASPGEREELELWFPDVMAEIADIESELQCRDDLKPEQKVWGWGCKRADFAKIAAQAKSGPLCTTCTAKVPLAT